MTTSSKAPKTTSSKAKTDAPAAAPVSADTSTTPQANSASPIVTHTLAPVVVGNELRKKELIELVVGRSGMKRKDVKPVVEAMLAVLGDAFAEQREMNVPPLGKFKVQRAQKKPDGRALVIKLRQKSAALNATPGAVSGGANTSTPS